MLLERLNDWSLRVLPRLNRAVLARTAPPAAVADELAGSVLRDLPPPETFSPEAARRLLVHLGLWGASVARHYQEQDPIRKTTPAVGFQAVPVGSDRTPFLEYFARAAQATATGHAPRDSYASLVRWNVPPVEIHWDGELLATVPGAFDDPHVRTYTGDPGERHFFELIKMSEALEVAVNDLVEPLVRGTVELFSPEAVRRCGLATNLLIAMRQLNLGFAARPPEDGLSPDHFLDVFRQFAVHWEPGDIPPSGAQDPEFLKRDFLLGLDFPNYATHTRRVFPALLSDERAALTSAMQLSPLPTQLLGRLQLDRTDLAAMPASALRNVLREYPILAATYLLLNANARAAGVHLMLVKKFLFKPARQREENGVPDHPLVSNRRGTTGMDETLLERLTQARRSHPLVALHDIRTRDLVELTGVPTPRLLGDDELATVVRITAGARPDG